MNRQLRHAALRLQGEAIRPLHALQRAGHRERLAAENFQLGADPEIVGGFFRPPEPRIGQAAEIVAPRIAAAAGDRGGEQLVSATIVAGEVGVDAPPIQFIQQGVLRDADRPAEGQHRSGTRQCEFPEHTATLLFD